MGAAMQTSAWTAALLSFAAALGCPGPAAAVEYLLGPQDKVRLKIYEWRASRDVIFEWKALNDEFVVGADGTLFLPFVGQIRAEGTAPADLSRSIGGRLMQQMGLGKPPDVSVEIIQFRPFYIVGHVTESGEFPYRPGLTVLQAVSIAGGLRTREESIARLEREVIAGRGEMDILSLNTISLSVKKARLEAEYSGASEISFPDQLLQMQGTGSASILIEQERAVFNARKDGLATQVRALENLKEFLVKELASLEKQMTFHDKQIQLVEKELAGVSTLVKKGISAAPREISLQRTLADVQSAKLTAETSLLRARQEISRTDIAILQLRNAFANDVAEALRETQAQLDETTRKTDTTANLLQESELTAPRLLSLRANAQQAQPIYTILRRGESATAKITATEITEIQPGDTLKVEMPSPDMSPAELGSTFPFAGLVADPTVRAGPSVSERAN
jgi:polysaccharide export outer membrane protein/exopolysaccharide production protein ExoF